MTTSGPFDQAIADALAAVERCASPAEPPRPRAAETPASDPADRAELAREVERLRAELAAAQDQRLRLAADLDNQRKRGARDRNEAERFGNERLLKALLPVVDGLDRALDAAGDHPLRSGVELTRRLLEEALTRFGVRGFSARGEPFDPRLHQALMTVATEAHPAGTVVEEQQRGFLLHDRLIRPAAVVVAAPPPKEP